MLSSPMRPMQHGLHRFNPSRDLRAVAELMQVAFGDRLDAAGQVTLAEMTRVARRGLLLNWYCWLTLDYGSVAPGYVWVEDGRVVGNVSLRRIVSESAYMVGNVAVHPDWRRRGIGTALMKAALDDSLSQRSFWVGLEVREDNPAARGLYEKLGFREIGRTVSVLRPAGPVDPRAQVCDTRSLRRARSWEDRELLRLARSSIPAAQRAFFELHRDNYRIGLERWLKYLVHGRREVWFVAPGEHGGLRGAVRALSERRGRPHRLEVLVQPDDEGRLEVPLVYHGLANLRGVSRRAVEAVVPASSRALIEALASAGIGTSHILIQMRLDVHQHGW